MRDLIHITLFEPTEKRIVINVINVIRFCMHTTMLHEDRLNVIMSITLVSY